MSQTTLDQNLHQDVEVSYWDDISQTHSIFSGRLLDVNSKDNWIMIKCADEVIMLETSGIESVFVKGREVHLPM
jgi:hypothetical protein